MEGRWLEAVAANKKLLENFPGDVDAHNRLGRAYMELGEYARAREAYEKAASLDAYNTIAQKNLSRLAHLSNAEAGTIGFHKVEPQQFIEEAGKAGVMSLYRLAAPEVLARMVAGGQVNLKVEGVNLIAENIQREYLGQVEPKHGQRLIRLMEGGNRYNASIVSVTENGVTVIIREVYQDPSQAGRLSFPPKGSEAFRPYASDRIIRREIEYEEALLGQPSYTIVSGGTELIPEETMDVNEEDGNDEVEHDGDGEEDDEDDNDDEE
ncbi:MAG: tetratricopeptide repeat protein [Chloroflexi bacterium]|nr:tetratricopeptide repeat protein [Chloroflexota bacterium]